MFDKIVFISNHAATIKLKDSETITMNLMNLHIVFEDDTKKVLGEVNDVKGDTVNATFLGEIVGGRFLGGTIRKPRLDAKIRVINNDEILLITGKNEQGYMSLGNTPFYEGTPVYLDVNNFFSGHFAIMGNSGSGKSCGISRLFQNMFHDSRLNPYNANIIMIDSSGEYYNAFSNLNTINPNYHYRFITTNEKDDSSEKLRIPVYLLNDADLALLLQVTSHSQLPIIERMRKLALVFSQKDVDSNSYKNHLIAKAIMTILYTNETAPNKRNEIFSVLASCSTPQFNLEAVVQGIGYTRKFRECFLIDNSGNFTESVLITEYVSSFIDDKLDAYEPHDGVFYTLETLEKALNFTLISEGWLRNKNTYGDAVTIKVRLHSLIVSDNAKFFDVKKFMTVTEYLKSLVHGDNVKYQFVNINLDDVDDDFAKVITKIYSRMIFDHSKSLTERASNPFHLIIEEAHRYIQNDNDRFLIGYNVFERIAKEGRKYGVILGIITQRPVELSDTVISQCSNFLIFKMNHPVDVDYIRKMVPNISDEIIEKQKTLQAGTCLGFGSAFKIPMIVRMEMPNPAPWSGNCDVVSFWGGGSAISNMAAPVASVEPASTQNMELFSTLPSEQAQSDMNSETSPKALVSLKIDDPEVPSMHAGEFGLVEKVEDDKSEEIKVPTTDAGVSLVNLNESSDTVSNYQNIPNAGNGLLVNNVSEGISVVDFSNSSNNISSMDSDVPAPVLVSFNTPAVTVNNPSENVTNNMNNAMMGEPSMPSIPGVSNQSLTPSVIAAPSINTNVFENTGTGDTFDSSNISGLNFVNSEPSGIGEQVKPNLVDLNVSNNMNGALSGIDFGAGDNNLQISNSYTSEDTFGKPDFASLNANNTDFNPLDAINNVNDNSQGNDGFMAPSNINFGGEQNGNVSGADNIQFNSNTPLVSFLNQQ